ncbi:hypothetical protein KSP40_PGU006551 [Platanthera guangdongensis]|uniref:Uncharacterized protein n=1 Tax=Platanthera guangdongensis TaxID=2320717 RepID=A0ABR2N2S1_9ASPA
MGQGAVFQLVMIDYWRQIHSLPACLLTNTLPDYKTAMDRLLNQKTTDRSFFRSSPRYSALVIHNKDGGLEIFSCAPCSLSRLYFRVRPTPIVGECKSSSAGP